MSLSFGEVLNGASPEDNTGAGCDVKKQEDIGCLSVRLRRLKVSQSDEWRDEAKMRRLFGHPKSVEIWGSVGNSLCLVFQLVYIVSYRNMFWRLVLIVCFLIAVMTLLRSH